MCKTIKNDERFCLICNKPLKKENPLSQLIEESLICENCLNQLNKIGKVYQFQQDWIVLYEYNEFLERLLFRYKEQRDRELKSIFLNEYKDKIKELSQKYCFCVMCSSDQRRLIRGFEPIIDMFSSLDIEVYSPLFKTKDIKQSSQKRNQRSQIQNVIQKKELYSLPNKPIVLVDDVLTTGNTIKRGIELLKPEKILVICANPIWIQANNMAKQKRF